MPYHGVKTVDLTVVAVDFGQNSKVATTEDLVVAGGCDSVPILLGNEASALQRASSLYGSTNA